jgi:hypothetical protein
VQQALTGNVDMGTATGNAPSSAGVNAGVYTQFDKGNGSGVLIRVAANGAVGTGAHITGLQVEVLLSIMDF